MKNLIFTISLFSLLLSCTNNDTPKNPIPPADTTSTAKDANNDYYTIAPDSVTILPFEIKVTLSPNAEKKITDGKETIIVAVFFEGTPKDSSKVELAEDDSFFVTKAEREIGYGQTAKFEGIKFSRTIYDQLADKDIDVTINVYSGRKSSPDNLLTGGTLFDKVSNVVNKQFTVNCKLIRGDD